MKVGMNLLLWTDCPTVEHKGLISQIKEWGFDGVEFNIAPMSDHDIRELAHLCDDLELGRTAIFAMDASTGDPSSPDPKLRQGAIEQLKRVADQTKQIGSDIIVGPLFQGLGRFSGQGPTEDDKNRAAETLRAAAEYADSLGIRIALEPLNRFEMFMANTMSAGSEIVRRIGMNNVGLLADTHHGNIEEENTAQAWRAQADLIYHVHISENHRGTPGKGQAIPPEIFQTLRDIEYDGWVTIEAFNQSVPGLIPRLHLWRSYAPTDEEIAREGCKFIRQHLG